jgi:uncharacterized protein
MMQIQFNKDQARTMLLAAQGFAEPIVPEVSMDDVQNCIRRMGVLQIDTIHVVARSPYFVLWSRLGTYRPELLEDLLVEKKIFEYWSHEACFIPAEDYAYYRRFMLDGSKKGWWFRLIPDNREKADAMLQYIRENGPTRSSDFERTNGQKGGWWNWKDEKVMLDGLFTVGELMIDRRERFQRVYDLRERVVPHWQDSAAPSYEEVLAALVEKSVCCLGVACATWCADYFRLPKKEVLGQIARLAEKGVLVSAQIEGLSQPAYVSASQLGLALQVLEGNVSLQPSSLLSPFDPAVWDRKRALELFDFDYRIECYVPEPKRKYGYFVLPILVGNRLVGRLDAKAHRKEKVFEVKELYLEQGMEVTDEIVGLIGQAIKRCALWHKTPTVKVSHADKTKLARSVQAAAKAYKETVRPAIGAE